MLPPGRSSNQHLQPHTEPRRPRFDGLLSARISSEAAGVEPFCTPAGETVREKVWLNRLHPVAPSSLQQLGTVAEVQWFRRIAPTGQHPEKLNERAGVIKKQNHMMTYCDIPRSSHAAWRRKRIFLVRGGSTIKIVRLGIRASKCIQ